MPSLQRDGICFFTLHSRFFRTDQAWGVMTPCHSERIIGIFFIILTPILQSMGVYSLCFHNFLLPKQVSRRATTIKENNLNNLESFPSRRKSLVEDSAAYRGTTQNLLGAASVVITEPYVSQDRRSLP